MDIIFLEEFKLDSETEAHISNLLRLCFPQQNFEGRSYFRQRPHYRLLMTVDDRLVGQMGLDYRMMCLNQQPVAVLGIIDLAIDPECRHKGYATLLLKALDHLVDKFPHNIDFLLLTSEPEQHQFYQKFGFQRTQQTVRWLAIENHSSYGLKEELIEDQLLYKQTGYKKWVNHSVLDMLGYWY
ncbi:GNAT family N-acetyltransferase [Acinetobacter sp. WZC-1]|uniref:GNAT family N-acetyltransferase n=1 Tax=Acinetobacter sp. WZC-1 TaxID=3459034 RepID=UPI00403DB3AF